MLINQNSELQARIRRFTRSVSDQSLSQDEILSPVAVLDRLHVAPWRDTPRAFRGRGIEGAATGTNLNIVGVSLAATDPGCALIHSVTVGCREVPTVGAAATLQWLLLFGTDALTDTASPLCYLLEPISRPGGIMANVPPRIQSIATRDTITLQGAILAEELYALVSSTGLPLSKTWRLDPPALLTGATDGYAWIGGTVNNQGVGPAPVEVSLSVEGEYFPIYPRR